MEIKPEPELGQEVVAQASSSTAAAPVAKIRCKLNPYAKEFDYRGENAPVEKRKYGPHVDSVYVHRNAPGVPGPPLFGKIVFTKFSIPLEVLKGKEETNFTINGKQLCCKKYDPNANRIRINHAAGASNSNN
ncbi:hypothetical protein LWI28_013052 [Acer negundo]|uniref:Uncharacterized protein n=1 Tax=Acer negundo TaxID=4023 RepID=A0AAD5IZ47_ACENE|nr:hypothetical protein LWI28_013052 [Acer negundo]KAK4847253.1 hypothetical protein QYF36_000033 [Acer negundo]KAK4849061.1 hypothetical protein QYF36_020350 [Acer negundo]